MSVFPGLGLALGIGQGVLGGIQAKKNAKAQAMQQKLQLENQNFQQELAINRQNRNVMRQWEAQLRQNQEQRFLATGDVARQTLYAKLAFDNQHSALSKQTTQVNDAMISNFAGRGIDPSSGSARAILRQNLSNASANSAGLKMNERNALRDIDSRYQNIIRSLRDPFAPDQASFVPGSGQVVDNSRGAFMGALVQGVASGAQSYVSLSQLEAK